MIAASIPRQFSPAVQAPPGAWVDAHFPQLPPPVREAMLAADCPEEWRLLYSNLGQLPLYMAKAMSDTYRATRQQVGIRAANLELQQWAAKVRPPSLRLASSDGEIRDRAEAWAGACRRMAMGRPVAETLPMLSEYAVEKGVVPPEPSETRGITVEGCVARLADSKWWRRAIRHTVAREAENAAIYLRLVHKKRGTPYASQDAVVAMQGQRKRNRALLEAIAAVNDEGQEYTLQQLSDLSVSNPELRHNELMARISGFDAIAVDLGHAREFWTLTCPSRFHRMHAHGEANSNYDEASSPREAQQYLGALWARVRSYLHRRGLRFYGVRVAEPHHDATPHWHLLMFFPAQWPGATARAAVPRVRAILRRYALQDSPGEPGAIAHRFKAERIDPKKGSAAAYLIKYVSKHTGFTGEGEQQGELFGDSPKAKSERVQAWATRHGIRQFQFLGGPPVTVWRELRLMDYEDAGALEAARAAADHGEWADYVRAQGGPLVKRADVPVRPLKMQEWKDGDLGVIPVNGYGEPTQGKVIGVQCGNVYHVTRWRTWRIGREACAPPPPPRLSAERLAEVVDLTRGPGHVTKDPQEFEKWLQSRPDAAELWDAGPADCVGPGCTLAISRKEKRALEHADRGGNTGTGEPAAACVAVREDERGGVGVHLRHRGGSLHGAHHGMEDREGEGVEVHQPNPGRGSRGGEGSGG